MLSFFKSPAFRDPQLGAFVRSRGHWRGELALGGSTVPFVLAGGRSEPDVQALQLARTVSSHFPAWRAAIAEALFEHYQPYAEAVAAGEAPEPNTPLPRIGAPSDVWPHAVLVFVSVTPIDRALAIEFGFATAWDEEHTLGARFQGGKLLELNGSVLPP
jgi:hypothetical protein